MSPSAIVPTSAALIGHTGRSFHQSQQPRVCLSAEQRTNWDRRNRREPALLNRRNRGHG